MRRLLFALVATPLFAPLVAHADTTTPYSFEAMFPGGGTITGGLVFDDTTDQFTSADLVPNSLEGGTDPLTNIGYEADPDVIIVDNNCTDIFCVPNSVTIDFELSANGPVSTFVDYDSDAVANSSSLTVVPTPAETPEPSG